MFEQRHISPGILLGILDLEAFAARYTIKSGREQELKGAQFVLEQMLGQAGVTLSYTEHRKPYLAGRPEHISISHSHSRLVILMNRHRNTGVDIELIRDKVLAIRHKFLNEREARFAGANVETLISIWAAKEALYKYHGLKGLNFKTNISVQDFDGTVIFGKIETKDLKKEFHLIREKIEEYMLVYILNEI